MLFSMGVDWWRSRALGRIATKYDSQALEADALHFSTDIWSAGVVVLGLALVMLGRNYHIGWLRDSDPIAALFVAGVVVSVSWRLARRTIDALLDAAPPGVRSQIYDAVSRVDGVLEVDRVRIRRAGNRYFADLAVGLARTVTFQRSGQLAAAVTESVHRILPDADVTVQPLPRAQHTENIFDRIRAVATHQQSQRARHQRAGSRRATSRRAARRTRRAHDPQRSARPGHGTGSRHAARRPGDCRHPDAHRKRARNHRKAGRSWSAMPNSNIA